MKKPKVLILDVETAPIMGYVWGLWENNLGLNQIKKDWHILSFAAKWLDEPESKVIYHDQRGKKNVENDSKLLKKVWKLLNSCDILITQNGKAFDEKKLNARFIMNGMSPPAPYKSIDTLRIAKKRFGFTSNKLEYLTDKLCTKHKKSKHAKFSGFELWKECMAGNLEAWEEMRTYNIKDILSLEELYKKLQPWDNSISFSLYSDEEDAKCNCGSDEFHKRGFSYTKTSKYQRFQCQGCGGWFRGRENLLKNKGYVGI
jgi:hypothetical protein